MVTTVILGVAAVMAFLMWDHQARMQAGQHIPPLVFEGPRLRAEADFTITYSYNWRVVTFSDNYPPETRVCYRAGCLILSEIAQGAP